MRTTMKTKRANEAVVFFLENAGFSYNPKTETQEQGKMRCARILAKAERQASERGFFYRWSIDPHNDSSDFDDDHEPWQLWQCSMYNADGRIVNSLHGIDFGRDVEPWGNNYRRVVEAELATDGLTN
jgi:hypothetical protein